MYVIQKKRLAGSCFKFSIKISNIILNKINCHLYLRKCHSLFSTMRATCCNALCRHTGLQKFLPSTLCVPLFQVFPKLMMIGHFPLSSLPNPLYCIAHSLQVRNGKVYRIQVMYRTHLIQPRHSQVNWRVIHSMNHTETDKRHQASSQITLENRHRMS